MSTPTNDDIARNTINANPASQGAKNSLTEEEAAELVEKLPECLIKLMHDFSIAVGLDNPEKAAQLTDIEQMNIYLDLARQMKEDIKAKQVQESAISVTPPSGLTSVGPSLPAIPTPLATPAALAASTSSHTGPPRHTAKRPRRGPRPKRPRTHLKHINEWMSELMNVMKSRQLWSRCWELILNRLICICNVSYGDKYIRYICENDVFSAISNEDGDSDSTSYIWR